MKKGSTAKTLDNFDEWMGAYISLLEKIIAAKYVVGDAAEKRELIEAFVLRICALWEILVEALMIDCLNRDGSALAKHLDLSLDKHLKRPICEAIISGLHYFDFKNVGTLKKNAKNVLVGKHNPFVAIPADAAKKIDEFFVMRNYLSHYSLASKRALIGVYTRNHGLKTFREPGHFLHARQGNGGQIRLADYVAAFLEASTEMRKVCT